MSTVTVDTYPTGAPGPTSGSWFESESLYYNLYLLAGLCKKSWLLGGGQGKGRKEDRGKEKGAG